MMRILLFLATNLAIVLVASITLSLLGVESIMAQNGVDLDLGSLLVFCAVFGMAGSLVSLFISKWMAKRATRTQVISQPSSSQERWLMETVAELAQKAGIGMPEVGIFPSPQANAFATGWNRNSALVAVSEGLLKQMKPNEVRAVLAHEIGHVANGDMITLTLIQGVVNTFVMFFARIIGHTVDRAVFKTERGHGIAFYITTFIAEMILGILASTIVMWFSRWREFRADSAGANLAGRNDMIAALQRLQAQQGLPNDMPGEMTALAISSQKKTDLAALFSSHPPLEKRIQALRDAA
ncbi:Protease HtpX [Zhongshania aliphaticivorans]|uniref:Protease HtpX n=1 Tax=Zhongshania aliphaticivorans TaxID=1470434 RepID=A0A5S9NCT3_9GAMM|nr:protease HtpX [Zhongshania aliphaticivorans]CAA0079409.1 Protease HtpX [Zhongshania aliphaticivorans]CAA0086160.1 Protease HtpX [Zhongshania aliphaticivorans]